MASGPIEMDVKGWQRPKDGFRKAWLRHRLPEMMWRFEFERSANKRKDRPKKMQPLITWRLYISWNMACPIFIYRLEIEPAEGVEDGE